MGSALVAVGIAGGGATCDVDGIAVEALKSMGDAGGVGVSWARGGEVKGRAQRASDACCVVERRSDPDQRATKKGKVSGRRTRAQESAGELTRGGLEVAEHFSR